MGAKNPFRYRSYYYDEETGFYYVGSRYYDSVVGRFISPDAIVVLLATPMALTDKNLFSYCDNNPIIRVDTDGYFWHMVVGAISGAITGKGTGTKHLMTLGTQSVTRPLKSGGLSAAVNEAKKAATYYLKSTASYYEAYRKQFFKDLIIESTTSATESFLSTYTYRPSERYQ